VVLSPTAAAGGTLLAAGALALAALPAEAVAPPDSAGRAVLQSACDSAWRVRVATTRAVYETEHAMVYDDGIRIAPPRGRMAVVQLGDPRPVERRLGWDEIEGVQAEQPRAARGALMGFLVGAALGGGLIAVVGPDLSDTNDHVVVLFAAAITAGFTGLGLILGSGNPAFHPLYP
jgi:hypothetical protein